MHRGANAGSQRAERTTPPGVFETIAIAMSALLVQPLPLAFPLAVDLYLWGGARLSPAAVLDPFRRWLLARGGAETAEPAEWLERAARTGDLAAIVGWFVPSFLAGADRAEHFAAWRRPSVDLGGAAPTLAVAGLLVLLGVWAAMMLAVLLARVVRGRALLGGRFLRASGLAAVRYLGFLALATLVLLGVAAAVALAFVGEAIVLAEVGPLRAIALSVGVVRRNPWPTLGLLLVWMTVSLSLPRLADRLTATAPGLALAVAAYAFVATGLVLARMQFFYDRLRRWRADAIPPLAPAS